MQSEICIIAVDKPFADDVDFTSLIYRWRCQYNRRVFVACIHAIATAISHEFVKGVVGNAIYIRLIGLLGHFVRRDDNGQCHIYIAVSQCVIPIDRVPMKII